MSPCRLNGIDELNYLISLRDLDYFKTFIMSNRVSYRVSMFKAIESGSVKLTDIVRWHHPHPEEQDAEFEALHAAFRGHLSIYQTIQLNQDMEEFNTYRENMFLYHGRLEQVNMAEIDMHDLLSPNIIPVSVCDIIVSDYGHSTCLMTGVLLAYCIHNSDNYSLLETNPNIFIMDMMFQYAICNNNNEKLKQFLVWKYKQTRQHSDYDYRVRKGTFCKRKQYNGKLDMYDHYLAPCLDTGTITTAAASLIGIKKEGKLCTGGDANYADKIDMGNVQLSTDLFEWQSSRMAEYQIDAYFEQVLDYVNRLINQGVELQKQ
ncbi:hypothetical protein [Parasitella parasitica]|uniref:Uncharacterized protein n=1 Tax=Parasitella parasitica TaxID=35722 RepID=A0A0B7NBB6_9FUNG|nr:hypothetical protein [Parasitella parasitica]